MYSHGHNLLLRYSIPCVWTLLHRKYMSMNFSFKSCVPIYSCFKICKNTVFVCICVLNPMPTSVSYPTYTGMGANIYLYRYDVK